MGFHNEPQKKEIKGKGTPIASESLQSVQSIFKNDNIDEDKDIDDNKNDDNDDYDNKGNDDYNNNYNYIEYLC